MAAAAPPVVSVITVCFNAAATLDACMRSVIGQTWPAIEYVVIDGGSTDGTRAILERHRDRIATLVSEPDRGIYDAMNKGIAAATGEFVIFLNADDLFAGPETVAQAMAEIAANPDGDIYYGSILVRGDGFTTRHDPPPPEHAAEEMVLGCLPHQATFARRSVFARTGPFDLRWRRHADYDWWLKAMADPGVRLRRIGTLVASFRLGGASSELAKGQPEVFAIQNAAAIYRSPEWDRRRIEMLQRAWLEARIGLARAEERGLQAGAMPLRRKLAGRLRGLALRHLPSPVLAGLRSLRQRRQA
jgi:glycosyltransferase involved in cell wall biosynthesis